MMEYVNDVLISRLNNTVQLIINKFFNTFWIAWHHNYRHDLHKKCISNNFQIMYTMSVKISIH